MLFNPADRSQRGIPGLSRRHPSGEVFLDLPVEVIAEFLVQFLFDSPAAQ